MAGGGGSTDGPAVGFAKLQGDEFEYYMQTYSVLVGRGSKRDAVDVDLGLLGGGGAMNISRKHARIYYDFPRRRFALEVLGKNGCLVAGVLHEPGADPVELRSRDLIQIGDKKFYFLLPTCSIFGPTRPVSPRRPQLPCSSEEEEADWEEEEEAGGARGYGMGKHVGLPVPRRMGKKSEARAGADREADNLLLLQLEEKDVLSCVAAVLSDHCGRGEWMPMAKLHAELSEQYGNIWHHSRVRRYLTSEDWPQSESRGKPWFGLVTLLRKHPGCFLINLRTKGRLTTEFISLVPSVRRSV